MPAGKDTLWAWISPTTQPRGSEKRGHILRITQLLGGYVCAWVHPTQGVTSSLHPGSSNMVNPRQAHPNLSNCQQPTSTSFSLSSVSFPQGAIPKESTLCLTLSLLKVLTPLHTSPLQEPILSEPLSGDNSPLPPFLP